MESSIEIPATPEQVMSVIADPDSYPSGRTLKAMDGTDRAEPEGFGSRVGAH